MEFFLIFLDLVMQDQYPQPFFLTTLVCSNPGYPFCTGVTLAKLAAVTMDEQGNETFDTSGALDKLRKVSFTSLFMKLMFCCAR